MIKAQRESVLRALLAFQEGKMVVVVDDEDRENEGDLVAAAIDISPEMVNFMAKEARGLICAPLEETLADALHFFPMAGAPQGATGCHFTVSVDLKEGTTTGISAADRAKTLCHIASPTAVPQDFYRPGHIFPLRAKTGGVLVRAGHTEAAVDLCRLSGKPPVGVICEIMNDDGTMARGAELRAFSEKHGLPFLSIADLIAYRYAEEILVEECSSSVVSTAFGIFISKIFREKHSGQMHAALLRGNPTQNPLVRVDTDHFFPDFFLEKRAEGEAFLRALSEEDNGIFLRMRSQQEEGDQEILRQHGIGAQILRAMGVRQMRLLVAHPKKIPALSGFDLEISEIRQLS